MITVGRRRRALVHNRRQQSPRARGFDRGNPSSPLTAGDLQTEDEIFTNHLNAPLLLPHVLSPRINHGDVTF